MKWVSPFWSLMLLSLSSCFSSPKLCCTRCLCPVLGLAQHRKMLQDGPCWDMKGVSLLKPAAWDTRSWCPHSRASQFSPCANWSSLLSPSSIAPCLVIPGRALLQDPSSGSSTDQVPTEGIARRGCNAHGAHQKPIAFCSLPWHVAASWCFSRFMFRVCLSVEGKWYPGL